MIQSTLEARDPVCGMTVEPSSAAARRTLEGRDVFFCAAGCAAAFDRDPKKYTGPDRPVATLRSIDPRPATLDAPGISLSLQGMHCASCVTTIERALADVPGVEHASVNLAAARADVRGSNLDTARLVAAVQASGNDARPTAGAGADDPELRARSETRDVLRLSPIIVFAAMAASSISVVTNSLRLAEARVTPDRIAAIVIGAALLVFLAVFFFGKRRAVAAGSEITIVVEGGYSPDLLVARRGVPLTLIFDRRKTSPCSDEIVLPDFGIRRALPAHAKTRIEILPERAGEFPFSCGMNMLHGRIRVVE